MGFLTVIYCSRYNELHMVIMRGTVYAVSLF